MENYNPFEAILSELRDLRQSVDEIKNHQNQQSPSLDSDKYECGVHVAEEELGLKTQTIYQRIGKLPHRKCCGKLYFNRAELQEYIRNQGK